MDILLVLATLATLLATYVYQKRQYATTGLIFGLYPWSDRVFFAPIYEELIFRVLLVSWLGEYVSTVFVVVVSSALFGLWHVKNYWVQPTRVTVVQVVYAGAFLGPILAILTLWYGNVLPAMLLHALNNLVAPVSQRWLKHWRW